MAIIPFTLYNPVRVHFGHGQLKHLADEIPENARVLLTYGGGSIKKHGLYDKILELLAPRKVVPFGGIEPNPRYETLCKAIPLIKEHQLDFILAVGGGSVIDGSKFIAVAALYPHDDLWKIVAPTKKKHRIEEALPLGTVLTISATGSEMNRGSVITREETQEKLSFHEDVCFPRFSIVDPDLMLTLPPHQVANGVVDAFVHVIEQYLTFPINAMVQDAFAEGLLRTLLKIGPKLKKSPQNMEARENLSMVAMLALNGLIAAGVPEDWATHRIGHELTALFGLDHAVSLALVLPHLLRDQLAEKQAKLAQCAYNVFGLTGKDEQQLALHCIACIEQFLNKMIPYNTLRNHGIKLEDALEVAARFKEREWELGERGKINHRVVKRILKAASKL